MNTLLTIPFYLEVVGHATPIVKKYLSEADPKKAKSRKAWRSSTRSRMNLYEQYTVDVFHRLCNLTKILDRLNRSHYLLKRFPTNFRNRKVSLGRNDWVEYHLFVHTTALASVLDCALILTANTFSTALAPELCKFKTVSKHRSIAKTSSEKALWKLRKTLDPHTMRRHKYVHRGEDADFGELTDPESTQHLQALTLLANNNHIDVNPLMLKVQWKFAIQDLDRKLNVIEDNVHKALIDLLRCLLPVFHRYSTSLKQVHQKPKTKDAAA